MAIADLTSARLKELLSYNPETGLFFWKKALGKRRTNIPAGYIVEHGYVEICVDRKRCYGHRLAWLHEHGEWPADQIDHRNGNKSDNRILNLRPATNAGNGQNLRVAKSNNSTGMLGSSYCKRTGRYVAQIFLNGKTNFLGRYDTAEEAHQVYLAKKRQIHPMGTL